MTMNMSTGPCIFAAITITVSTAPLRQDPAHHGIRYLALSPSLESTVPCWRLFLIVLAHDFKFD